MMIINYFAVFIFFFSAGQIFGTIVYLITNAILIGVIIVNYNHTKSLLSRVAIRIANAPIAWDALKLKKKIMLQSLAVGLSIYGLELIYHGILDFIFHDEGMDVSLIRWIIHECTDLCLMTALLVVQRARLYVPYYSAINIDQIDYFVNAEQQQQIDNVYELTYQV